MCLLSSQETEESRLQFTGLIFHRKHLFVNSVPVHFEAVIDERQTPMKPPGERNKYAAASVAEKKTTEKEEEETANHFTAFIKLSLDFTRMADMVILGSARVWE